MRESEQLENNKSYGIISSQDKRALTLKLREEWTSVSMRNKRMAVWGHFESQYGYPFEKTVEVIKLSKFKANLTEPQWLDCSDIFQFFSDLYKLRSEGMLEDQLALILFKNSMEDWFYYIDKIQYDQHGSIYHDKVGLWYENYVKGLSDFFECNVNSGSEGV